MLLQALGVIAAASGFSSPAAASPSRSAVGRLRGGAPSMSTIAIVVDVEIKPETREEFLKVMEIDAVGSRAEEGCLRFDVLCDQANPNRFFFYEVRHCSACGSTRCLRDSVA